MSSSVLTDADSIFDFFSTGFSFTEPESFLFGFHLNKISLTSLSACFSDSLSVEQLGLVKRGTRVSLRLSPSSTPTYSSSDWSAMFEQKRTRVVRCTVLASISGGKSGAKPKGLS